MESEWPLRPTSAVVPANAGIQTRRSTAFRPLGPRVRGEDGIHSQPLTASRFEDLDLYREAFRLQQAVYALSKRFPAAERYSLTDQMRRASRSVGANVAEAWRKRRHPAHFVSKLSDADAELAETRHWLHTASACGYVEAVAYAALCSAADSVGKKIGAMIRDPRRWTPRGL